MLLSVNIRDKNFGDKTLYRDLEFAVEDNEKVGLIGRNGTGKTTLLNLVDGTDKDYDGAISLKRGSVLVSSRQEHHGHEHKTVLEYIQGDLPEYSDLAHILDTYPETMGDDVRKIQAYSDALQRFTDLGYFQLEDEISQAFEAYQIDPTKIHSRLQSLSGGQKRMVELMKVQRSRGHIALIDEPTNHMDYVAKKAFISWMDRAPEAVLVITHDRDVLRQVDRIIEIRDGQAFTFRGNYDAYLRTNSSQVTSQVNEYDISQKRIRNLTEDIVRFQRLKEKAHDPGTIKRFKSQEIRAREELARLQQVVKPSFWIDQESVEGLNEKLGASYEKYKSRNIRINTSSGVDSNGRMILDIHDLSLAYGDTPLFSGLEARLNEGERLRLHGRNGAGKTTLVNAIMAKAQGTALQPRLLSGSLAVADDIRIGLYEQEIPEEYLNLTLSAAIEKVMSAKNVPVSPQHVKQQLSDYLFDPGSDGDKPVNLLSGGQKARFQLISMLIDKPQLLILDEPTNHLDLPSIEELEQALGRYNGAVIYISHDSYFANKLGGTVLNVGN